MNALLVLNRGRPDLRARHRVCSREQPTDRIGLRVNAFTALLGSTAYFVTTDVAHSSESESGERWTVGRLLTWTADFLKRKGSESPRLDAEVLLAHVLKYPRYQLYVSYDAAVSEAARASFRELVQSRAKGSPVAYLVGRKEFYSIALEVSPAVLIPRPDTETLVAEFLTQFKDNRAPRVLDIGTGSGAIALACASQHPGARLVATDVSEAALEIARKNAARLTLAGRVEFRCGSLFDPIKADAPFDAILSNPPYIPSAAIAGLEMGVRDFEPHIALDGGADGLEVVRAIVAGAAEHLSETGQLMLEVGSAQADAVVELINACAQFEGPRVVRDASNHPRVVRARKRIMTE